MAFPYSRFARWFALVVALSSATACNATETSSVTTDVSATTGASTTTTETTVATTTTSDVATTTTTPPTTTPPTTTIAPTTTTTTLPPLSSTLPPPPPPVPCGVFPAIPAGALDVTIVMLDALGDGTADDAVTSYLDSGVGQWRIRLVLPVGSTSELDVPGVGAGFARVVGAVQVDGGGADEFLAVAGSGAATLNMGVFGATADGCLFRFSLGGSDLVMPVGGTVTRADGVTCTGTALSLGSAEDTGGGLWNVTNATLGRVAPTELAVASSSIVGGVATADLGNIATLNCPGLSLSP